MKEILIILFVLAIVILVFTQSTNHLSNNTNTKIRFNDIRHERHYDKNTGEIVGEKFGEV